MKDATSILRQKYIELLDDIIIDGVKVPVYDDELNDTVAPFTRENPPLRYIIISNQNSADNNSPKCTFDMRHTVQVDCCAIFPAYSGNSRTAEAINEQVVNRILPTRLFDPELEGFNVYRTTVDLSRNLSEKTSVQNIYKRITIFNHYIQEN